MFPSFSSDRDYALAMAYSFIHSIERNCDYEAYLASLKTKPQPETIIPEMDVKRIMVVGSEVRQLLARAMGFRKFNSSTSPFRKIIKNIVGYRFLSSSK